MWMKDMTDSQYEHLKSNNCNKKDGRVARATQEFEVAKQNPRVSDSQKADWDARVRNATKLCEQADQMPNPRQAAYLAVEAFGTAIMRNHLCCTRLRSPFCTIPVHQDDRMTFRSPAGILIALGAVLMLVMLLSMAIDSCNKRYQAERMVQEEAPEEAPYREGVEGGLMDATHLTLELQNDWIRGSPLRAMPGAKRMAASSASLFGSLFATFEFQQDSVRCQYEHLLSLWRSHVAIVADRNLDDVDEQFLLAEALDNLHCELLEGFLKWREKFRGYEKCGMSEPDGVPPAGGIRWEHIPSALCPDAATERSTQLVEIAVYLLVWGEAGNVRFMPEVIYFITELAISSAGPGGSAFYGARTGSERSGRFLARIIRPLYSLVFDEWYNRVEINEKGGDKKVLHKGFERYLLPDVANYDDWNEFFCDPSQVAKELLLPDGRGLFEDVDHDARFSALPNVHWRASLKGTAIKTHRECHSMMGVFAATHRVWFLHALFFFVSVIVVVEDAEANEPVAPSASEALSWRWRPLMGETKMVRLAAVGLLVPVHAFVWALARLETTSNNILNRTCGCCFFLESVFWAALWLAPIGTYVYVRMCANKEELEPSTVNTLQLHTALAVHHVVTFLGVFFLLLAPAKKQDKLFTMTAVPLRLRVIRYLFWFCVFTVKFLLGLTISASVWNAATNMQFINIGREAPEEILGLWRNSNWSANLYTWLILWLTAWWLFISDTAMWFQAGCMFLGVGIVFVQRSCYCFQFIFEDALQKIPERMTEFVFPAADKVRGTEISAYFPAVWDRVVAYMRYEDKCESDGLGKLSFQRGQGAGLTWDRLSLVSNPLVRTQNRQYTEPDFFTHRPLPEVCWRNYCDWDRALGNEDLKWRLYALARGLGLPMPRPYRAPYIPGITVMIPHYGETIILSKSELYDIGSNDQSRRSHVQLGQKCNRCRVPVREMVPLIDWLRNRYADEYKAFLNRMQFRGIHIAEVPWDELQDEQWDKICVWASMRMQTLYRTVAGMCLYHPALQVHYEVQKVGASCLAASDIWNPADCFTCLISMQIYKTFDKNRLAQTNQMFNKLPDSLKVAYIDHEDLYPGVEDTASMRREMYLVDHVHERQDRRYWSCLIDKQCPVQPGGRRTPRYRIELPGFPILGDGKSDNQNHAIPFMRGIFSQCIDANQGAYFEQMLLLPNVLGEFRTHARGKGRAKRIIGLPEHITSDFGSIGDFAAGSEIAFGTISQRSFAVLGGRMHYGHPDIMNKQYMMQQGGVSKATKTINLSEDIFAGMDFTLRGEGRKIKHCEYFHVAKGRDLGFNAVLGFFSKLSNGTGEQMLTRQMMRLSQCLQLPESLTFHYAHAGYYLTQYLISESMPILVFTWLLVVCADCNRQWTALYDVECKTSTAEAMGNVLGTWFSFVIFFFLIITSLPLFAEIWLERNFGNALRRWLTQLLTCSFLLFIFQAKIIGYYIMAEIKQGGASYVATGRGLPTDRRAFVGTPAYVLFQVVVTVQNLEWGRLRADEGLKRQAITHICNAFVAATGGKTVKTQDVKVSIPDRGNVIDVTISVDNREGTNAVKAKLGTSSVGDEVARQLAAVPGVGEGISATSVLTKADAGWAIENVGGLYLDYTQHTYYRGIELLFYTLLVLYAGGYSEAGPYKSSLPYTFVSIGLVIFAWLYAPFIFNPYQFSAGYLMDDLKAWYGFFFTNGGCHWKDWYERIVIKPRRGLGSAVFDFDLICMFFAVTAWISQLYRKQAVNETLYNQDAYVHYFATFTLIPPFLMSTLFCIIVPIIEMVTGCADRKKKRKTRALRDWLPGGGGGAASDSEDGGSSSDESADGDGEAARASPASTRPGQGPGESGRVVAEDMQAAAPAKDPCENGMPLALAATIVAALELFEAFAPVGMFIFTSNMVDHKLFVTGIVVKFKFWQIILFLLDSAISMKGCCSQVEKVAPCLREAIELLVYTNHMARDIIVSFFIGLTLSPWILFTAVNDLCCPNLSLHQFLIYRKGNPSPLGRRQRNRYQYDSDGESDAEDDSGTDTEAENLLAPSPPGPPVPTGTVGPPPGASQTMFRGPGTVPGPARAVYIGTQ